MSRYSNSNVNLIVVGISDMRTSTSERDVIVTYSLGSCVGLTLYDPEARVGGLAHCMLPLSRAEPEKAKRNPAMFTDTGISGLLQSLLDLGATRRRIVAKVAGAAAPLGPDTMFKIGERNYFVLRKVLWKNEILIASEDVGGSHPRTLALYMDTGMTTIRTGNVEREL